MRDEIKAHLTLNGAGFQRGLRRAQRDLKEFRQSVNQHMRQAALAVAGLAAGAILVGANFEKAMANVRSVSGATQAEMVALEASARKMGAGTEFGAQRAAEAQYALASAGLNAKQVIEVLPAVMNYAGATQADLADSTEAVTGAMAQFQLSAGEAGRVANVFAAGIASSPLTMKRLQEAMAQGGSAAAALGLDLEETVASLGLLHAAWYKGGQAGTSFKAVLMSLQDAMANQKGAIGEALQGWDAGSEGLAGAMRRIEAAGITGQQALMEMGSTAGPALAAMLGQGSAKLGELTQKVTGTNQAFQAYQIQMDTAAGRFAIFKSNLQEAGIQVWDVIKGPVKTALETLTALLQNNFDRIRSVALTLVSAVMGIATTLAQVAGFVAKHATVFQTLGAIILGAAAALYVVSAATAAWNAVLALNPVTLIVMGVAALVAAIVVVVEKFVGWKIVWEVLVAAAKIGFELIKGGLRQMWADIKMAARIVRALGETFGIIFTTIVNTVKRAGSLIGETFSSIWDMVAHPRQAKETFENLKKALSEGFGPVIDEAREKLQGTWSGLADGYKVETALIGRETVAAVAQIERDTAAKIAELRAEREKGGAGASVAVPGAPTLADGGPISGVPQVPVVAEVVGVTMPKSGIASAELPPISMDQSYLVLEEFTRSAQDRYRQTWDSMIDTDMSGAERRRAIFEGIKQHAWKIIGDMTKRWLWGETVQMVATQQKDAAVLTGATARIAAGAAELGENQAVTQSNVTRAGSGFFKAFSGIPFIGFALAAAAIAAMMKLLGGLKLHEGGLAGGLYGRDVNPGWFERGEYVMPVAQTAQYLPELEAMRRGSYRQQQPIILPRSQAQRGDTFLTLQVPRGSLLVAEDRLATKRWARRFLNEFGRLQEAYQE